MSINKYTPKTVGEGLASKRFSPSKRVPYRYPVRKPTRLKDFDYAAANMVFFATLCCLDKKQAFVKGDFNAAVVECIKKEKERIGHAVYAFCLMPDHLHLLVSPLESGIPITQFMGALSSLITRLSWSYGFNGRLFQRSFYDHVVRKDEDLTRVSEYILNNPVRKGIVERWQDYKHCECVDPLPL